MKLLCLLIVLSSCSGYARSGKPPGILIVFEDYIFQDTSLNRANSTPQYLKFLDEYIDTSNGDYPGYDACWVIDSLVYRITSDSTIRVGVHFVGVFTMTSFKLEPKTAIYDFCFVEKSGHTMLSEPKIPILLFPQNVIKLVKMRGEDEANIENFGALKQFVPRAKP